MENTQNQTKKRVYTFGNGAAEGRADMKDLLGGKGANLAEMNLIGLPVPPGFTITTEVCIEYYKLGKKRIVELLKPKIEKGIAHIESITNTKFGDKENPCLVSVRSGARASMPGMMDTILNLGINDDIVEGIAKKWNNERFAWDSYRRFVQMYGDVVLGMKPQNKEDIDPFEEILEKLKTSKGIKQDTELTVDDLKTLVAQFKEAVKKNTGKDFPQDPWEQLWEAIIAVFDSWKNERAVLYRKLNNIPDEWGTAVNVQAMVFGNMGNTSATGVAFTRDPATGEDIFTGEYLINAQGEDVVAGIRTPLQITLEGSRRWAKLQGISEEERALKYPSLEETMPECAKELFEIEQKLEEYFKDMQDIEFTIQQGKLWILQTRAGKRTGTAMVRIAIDMFHQGYIDEKTAIKRCDPEKLNELLHPVFDEEALKKATILTSGLPASPGAATGQIVFHPEDAERWHNEGKKVILCRIETSPEDLRGMNVAEGILTARGGMTSHAAVVARGMGKCCVSAANETDYLIRLIFQTSKFSFFLLYCIALPILLNTEIVLQLWLKRVPAYAVGFVRLILIYSLLDSISGPLWMTVQATGRIKKYQIAISFIILSNLLISYLFLKQGYNPYIVLWIRIFLNITSLIYRITYLKKTISFPATKFVQKVILNIVAVVSISIVLPTIINCFTTGFNGFICSTLISVFSVGIVIYWVGLNSNEKNYIKSISKNFKNRLK
jgi:pyruvate,phosphate dikinase